MKLFNILILACALESQAADISWGVATDVSSSSDVSVNGTLLEAFNLTDDSRTNNVVVNGVTFVASTGILPANASVSSFGGSTGDSGYDELLNTLDLGGGTNTVTLNVGSGNLILGEAYEIQVWYCDDRLNRVTPVGDGNGNAVSLESDGQFSTGTFIADESSQNLTLDSPGFGNAHFNAYQIRFVGDSVISFLSSQIATDGTPFAVNVTFSEAVIGLTEADFLITNGSVVSGSLSGSGDSYTITVAPNGIEDVTITLQPETVTDTDGDNNQNESPTVLVVPFNSDRATATLIDYVDFASGPYDVTAHFSELVSGLSISDFVVTNATLSNLINHNDGNYTVTVSPVAEGVTTLHLPEETVSGDLSGLGNLLSNTLSVDFRLSPKVEISGSLSSTSNEVEVYFAFTPHISGFTTDDIVVSNGAVTSLEMQGRREFANRFYKATIKALTPGDLSVHVPVGGVENLNDPGNTNTVSNTFTISVTDNFGERWVVDSENDWSANTGSVSNVTVANGYVEPTANLATFSSVIKSYPTLQQAHQVVFTQSAVWDNWVGAGNIGPTGAGNAPILLPVANDEYYFFGQNANQAYHAWVSSDMVNWTQLGQVSEDGFMWCTTAEYKDGTFYLFADTPNDHTPTLFTDSDLADGIPGTNHGIVFYDPTDGSDSAVIRDNSDDLFHIISEDWSPVKANTHSFDSPLATHASSLDAINGFTAGEHLPPIDFRTTPTGTFGTHNHPHLEGSHRSNPQVYEIHDGPQDAFGDWTAIKVGERYYMFADYEHHEGSPEINVGRFVSNSLYEEFELVGDIGDGHPDPTCGFAEGQFYLITQTDTDYISPGPWVNGVESRVGVDTNNDGTIDEWTAWQVIQETYDHNPDYARVVDVTPAAIDLSGLSPGYGFQFEFRVDNTVVADVSPIMDQVEMSFEPSHFQLWANDEGIPALELGDGNFNGTPDLVDFTLEEPFSPEVSEGGEVSVTVREEAILDGFNVVLTYSDDLDNWIVATPSTQEVKLLSSIPNAEGDFDLTFEVSENAGSRLFVRMEIDMP